MRRLEYVAGQGLVLVGSAMNGHVPNKKLGQHWLHDKASLEAMCQAAGVTANDTVLEIGPGLGPLTKLLVQSAKHVVAVEYDPFLAIGLAHRVQARNLTAVHSDILKYDLTQLPPGYKVAANVPYYITSKIVRLLLESSNVPSRIALLVQKEVAERLAAGPGQMSILSLSAQYYADVSLGPVVPAAFFSPEPQVDSQIITLTPLDKPQFPDIDTQIFFKVVKAGFAERRKKLRSSLAGGLRLDKKQADMLLAAAGVPLEARAQELSLQQWAGLARTFLGTIGQ